MTEAIDELGRTAQLLQLEKKQEAESYRLLRQEVPVRQRKAEGLCWSPVNVVERGFGLGARPYIVLERNPGDKQEHVFQAGSPVSLFDKPGSFVNGVVQWLDDSKMKVSLFDEDYPDWLDETEGVQLAFDDRSFRLMELALNRVINAGKDRLAHLREVLLGGKSPEFDAISERSYAGLNDSQAISVNRILACRDTEAVHGPPGTGKTTTIVAAIAEIVKTEDCVLVCAPSNAACDHLTRKLAAKGLKVLRIGELSRIDQELEQFTLESTISSQQEYAEIRELKRRAQETRKKAEKFKRSFGPSEREERGRLYREARSLNKEASALEDYVGKKVIGSAQAIVCTLIGSASRELQDLDVKTLFIDEAAQATEPATWVPILKAERVIFAGDPFQLPPTVKSREAEKGGLAISLMEKMMIRTQAIHMLEVQYRMNDLIMQFSNRKFYGSKLKSGAGIGDRKLSLDEAPLEFIDTAGCGFEEERRESQTSLFNQGEADVLKAHWEGLCERLGRQPECGIISPYKEQVRLLKELFRELKGISVQSIDGFQGQERDVIYISLVRSNPDGNLGFLTDHRRMNVALTRARKKLVVIGDSATLGADPFFEEFLAFAEREGSYRSAWEWMV